MRLFLTRSESAALRRCISMLDVSRPGFALSVLLGKPEESIGSDDIGELVRQGADDRRALEAAVGQDALRDRAPVMATGYGIDAPEQREAGFCAVRGER